MVKKLREGQEILLAPDIFGRLDNGKSVVSDVRNCPARSLDISSIDDKIIIYERQVKEWFLLPGQKISSDQDNHFLVLMVICSYVEGFIQNYRGEVSTGKTSKPMFVEGFKLIFDDEASKKNIESFYKHARCGLFHDGMTRGKILLYSDIDDLISQPFDFSDPDVIRVYPGIAIRIIDRHFESYLNDLKNPEKTELRNNFNTIFKVEGVDQETS